MRESSIEWLMYVVVTTLKTDDMFDIPKKEDDPQRHKEYTHTFTAQFQNLKLTHV